jgi:glyoxylase-like metal-dependent hydrolase (beta-lactamase superfamily II)
MNDASRELQRAGIHCIPVPTPFSIGDVNAYLIEDDPLTLIDSGPASIEALEALEFGLRVLGYSVADLELLLVTHHHVDHLGLIHRIASVSGAEIACLDGLVAYAAGFEANAAADDAFAAELMLLHGVAADTVAVLQHVAALTRKWGTAFSGARALADQDVMTFERRCLRVIHAPGHSSTDTVFVDDESGIVIAGDHLLANVSSNPLMSPDRTSVGHDGAFPRRLALIQYVSSLRATREIDATLVAGGHGPLIVDHRALIDSRLDHHEARAGTVLTILRQRRRSAHEIAEVMWGRVAVTQAFLTLSEVLGHLDLLKRDGLAEEVSLPDGTREFVAH